MGVVAKVSIWTVIPVVLAIFLQTLWGGIQFGIMQETLRGLDLNIQELNVLTLERFNSNKIRIERLESLFLNSKGVLKD